MSKTLKGTYLKRVQFPCAPQFLIKKENIMSADNGVYILKTSDNFKLVKCPLSDGSIIFVHENKKNNPITAYRVTIASAIENFDWYKTNQIYMLGHYMSEVWGKSPVFYKASEAYEYAKQIEQEYKDRNFYGTEYGINVVHATEFSFN